MSWRVLIIVVFASMAVADWTPTAAQDGHTAFSAADIEAGAQIYSAHCLLCHGTGGDAIGTAHLASGQYRRAANESELRALIQAGIPNGGMPPQKLSAPEVGSVIAYLYNMRTYKQAAPATGDGQHGKTLFDRRCVQCHRVTGVGSATAPDLSDIGRLRNNAYLQSVLLDPAAALLPINRPVTITLKDGRTIHGRRLNEDTYSVQIVDSGGHLRSIEKTDARNYVVEKTSAMPSFKDQLSSKEIDDIVAYLAGLKG